MIAIIDYDAGNIRNVEKALEKLGIECVVTKSPDEIQKADGLILPGVGAFPAAMERLNEYGLTEVIRTEVGKGKPFLGICLGMQLLLDGSFEHHYTEGLGLIPGKCRAIPEHETMPVPHMGWNELEVIAPNALTEGIDHEFVYYVHSFYADCPREFINAISEYSIEIPGMISRGNVYGAQFHPEKSATAGLKILKNFASII
ncbi:MAG: imidazole glycerol phosphate synthase subunit HisH [Lactobacillales bacterium]|jgi:glutamine amidotransferase|nr:imidazole glycerol phosphate synthase subunit HisH [Lactobacillales bacterium]